ncbi:ARC6/PARC6 family protein [Sphaerospermopsis aphanizomenoides BCCUSP55]|nr:ARC6/PARC6 family protein [Sphaerospermopsis aphanizomenoides BCCUSP55]
MRKLIFYFALLTIYGCDALPGSSFFVSQSNSASTASSASGCPDKPTVELREKDVEAISLNEQILTKSGQASATKAIGYKFTGKSGQKFNYQTNQTLCIWTYSPDNEIISGGTLPKSGNYIIQVSAPKGSTTFDLNMSLGVLQASSPPPVQPTNNYTPPASSPDNSGDNSTITTSSTTSSSNTLSQSEALDIVQRWYRAKPRMFAPPFDTSLVDELTTGTIHYKTVGTDGSIPWLRRNDAYYKYAKSDIRRVLDFSNSSSQPYIKVRVFEELYLYGRRGIDRDNSGPYQGDFIYWFEKDNGIWKISDYKKVS